MKLIRRYIERIVRAVIAADIDRSSSYYGDQDLLGPSVRRIVDKTTTDCFKSSINAFVAQCKDCGDAYLLRRGDRAASFEFDGPVLYYLVKERCDKCQAVEDKCVAVRRKAKAAEEKLRGVRCHAIWRGGPII